MRRITAVSLSLVGLSLAACGGGGGGGSDAPFFGGVYRGVIAVTDNPCGVPIGSIGNVEWTVNQDSNRIVLQAASGATYEGGPTGSSSFAVSSTSQSSGGCTTSTNVALSSVSTDGAQANVSVGSSCLPACTVRAAGPLTRSGGRAHQAQAIGGHPDLLDAIVSGLEGASEGVS